MTVLVAYASARPAAAGIAQQIAGRLQKSGISAVARAVNQVDTLQPYQAVVLGSAVDNRNCLLEEAAFLGKFSDPLASLPVWLFSTSAVGESNSCLVPKAAEFNRRSGGESEALSEARATIRFRDQRHFVGAFERGGWSVLGDLFMKVCGGSAGDHREWRDVNDWTAEIARELQGIDHMKERRRLHLSVRGRP